MISIGGDGSGKAFVECVSGTCVGSVAEVVHRALADAAREPDGFAPVTAVLYVDGNQRRSRRSARHGAGSARTVARLIFSYLGQRRQQSSVIAFDQAVAQEVIRIGRPLALHTGEQWPADFVDATLAYLRRSLPEWTLWPAERCYHCAIGQHLLPGRVGVGGVFPAGR